MDTVSEPPVDEEIAGHYRTGYERERLGGGTSRIEFARTKELLQRFLPPPPAAVLDVGGGPGAYASWLADLGYRVHLIDPVPLHVQQAAEAAQQPIQGRIHVRHATLAEKRDELITAGEQLIALLTHDGTIHEQTI